MAVLSITAASQGLTLTKASRVVFAEMNWTPSLMQQAEDRCHRNSQKHNVTCYYMFGESTLDNYIYDLISGKFNVVNNVIDGQFKDSVKFLDHNLGHNREKEFLRKKKMTTAELVEEAILNKIYGDIDDRQLIAELIETEMCVEEQEIGKINKTKSFRKTFIIFEI